MKILLLTQNHVVREFVGLAADKVSAKLFVAYDIADVVKKSYDFIFVDDRGSLLQSGIELLKRFPDTVSVVFYSKEQTEHAKFDIKLKKPFLPSDIQSILEYENFANEEIKTYLPEDQILNLQEIDEIKDLLEDEGLEIISEEELADEIDGSLPLQISETEIDNNKIQKKLLKALLKMDTKKVRKMLKGAEVTIRIQFPEDSK